MPRTKGRYLLVRAIPVLAAALAIWPTAASTAHAASHGLRAAAAAPRHDSFLLVSCTRAFWCMATGSYVDRSGRHHALAEEWSDGNWRRLPDPPGRTPSTLSCSARWFCMANGGPARAEVWNGRTWHAIKPPAHAMGRITCGSRTTCAFLTAGSESNVVESWNGTNWHVWNQATDVCAGHPPGPCGLFQVSCGSGSNCVAVGTQTLDQQPTIVSASAVWNGKVWGLGPQPPSDGNPAEMNAVGCVASFCMAAGGAFSEIANGSIAMAATYDASTQTWTDVSPDLGVICSGFQDCPWTSLMTCGNPTNCLSFFKTFLAWNGTTWNKAPPVKAGTGMVLSNVSCGGASCMAVGHLPVAGGRRALAELWNGKIWKVLNPPAPR